MLFALFFLSDLCGSFRDQLVNFYKNRRWWGLTKSNVNGNSHKPRNLNCCACYSIIVIKLRNLNRCACYRIIVIKPRILNL